MKLPTDSIRHFHPCSRLSELRQQKAKLSRQVRDKEEELEGSLQKMDALRNDLRRAEKLRRDLEARAEELMADVVREKRLRERAEENVRILHDDMERLQQKAAAGEAALNSLELNQEVTRLSFRIFFSGSLPWLLDDGNHL